MKRIAVFGGLGFIGSYLVDNLLERNFSVHVFDLAAFSSNTFNYTNVAKLHAQNLADLLEPFEIIIDLVYATNPKTSFEDPVSDVLKNLPNTVALLNIAKELPNLKNFIYVSSGGTVYGNTSSDIIKENHITNPISPYGITKLAIEKYGLMYNTINGFPFTIVRPANAYGIGQRPNTGQGFIIAAINAILNNKTLTIFGDHGTVRDYIYVSDIASAIADLAGLNGSGKVYNIGTGIGTNNLEVIEVLKPLAKQIGKNVTLKHSEERKFDVNKNVLDSTQLKKDTGWQHKISLEKGIAKTWEYSLKNL